MINDLDCKAQNENNQNNPTETPVEPPTTNTPLTPNNRNNSANNSINLLLPNLPQDLPRESSNFVPPNPTRRYPFPLSRPEILSKRIYMEMIRAIKAYSELSSIAPSGDVATINSLKSQMQILSLSMLNIYQQLSRRKTVPFYLSHKIKLNSNYSVALQEMYNRVYHIYALTMRLYNITIGSNISTTLLIIIGNLSSQLRTINNLRTN